MFETSNFFTDDNLGKKSVSYRSKPGHVALQYTTVHTYGAGVLRVQTSDRHNPYVFGLGPRAASKASDHCLGVGRRSTVVMRCSSRI
jgi:hypothetical protein